MRRAINGEFVLSMSSNEMHGLTVAELRHEIYIVIEADWADVDLVLTVSGETLEDCVQLETLSEKMDPVEVFLIVEAAPQFDKALPNNEQIPILKRMLLSSNIEKQQYASVLLRYKLFHELHSLLPLIIDTGIMPRLVQLARTSVDIKVQRESLYALSLISSGSTLHAQAVVDYGAVDIFVEKLSSPIQDLRDHAMFGIGNVAANSVMYRDHVLKRGAFTTILQELKNLKPAFHYLRVGMFDVPRRTQVVWALCSLCTGDPPPCLTPIESALKQFKLLLSEDNDDINKLVLDALANITKHDIGVVNRLVNLGFCPLVVKELQRGDAPERDPVIRWMFRPGLLESALDLISQLLSGTHAHKQHLVSCNVLEILHRILDHPKEPVRIAACEAVSKFLEGSIADIQLAIDEGSILLLDNRLMSDKADTVKEVALHALCSGALGGTLEQMVVITMLSIRSMLPMIRNGLSKGTMPVLKVVERVLINHAAKRRKRSIDATFSTICPIVMVILEKSYDKITELGELDLYNPLVAEKARRILCRLDSIVESEQSQNLLLRSSYLPDYVESWHGHSSSSSSKRTPQSYEDRRFEVNMKIKWFICDRCEKRVDYGGQSIPFQGNFLHRNPPSQYERQPNFVWDMEAKEKAWRDGTWNATWLCTDCLISHHHCSKAYAFQSGLIGNFSKQRALEKLYWQSRRS